MMSQRLLPALILLFSLTGVLAETQAKTDWPTYLHDHSRSGISATKLKLPLKLKWSHKMVSAPKSAWPEPAERDYWRSKNHESIMIFDKANHLIAADGKVYFGSSSNDSVTCLDAKSGATIWKFYTEGPIRFAPEYSEGKVYFGSDDGYVYCIDARSGKLVWKVLGADKDERLAGNERVIAKWPIRTSVLLNGDEVHYCAGIFPQQKVYRGAINKQTGKVINKVTWKYSAQGYLAQQGTELFIRTGNISGGRFVKGLKRRGIPIKPEVNDLPKEFPYAFIGTENLKIGGGDNKIALIDRASGDIKKEFKVEGKAYSVIVANGDLLVSTDKGNVYCFSSTNVNTAKSHNETVKPTAKYSQKLTDFLKRYNTQKGYCLVMGSANAKFISSLAINSELRIVVIENNDQKIAGLRKLFDQQGLHGQRVSVQNINSAKLPYMDYMFNLILTPSTLNDELKRVLNPRGVALSGRNLSKKYTKDPIKGAGSWTHLYANPQNTLNGGEQNTSNNMTIQWFGEPGPRKMVDRHHRAMSPLSQDGLLYVPTQKGVICVDAYNGTNLWENADIPGFMRTIIIRDCGPMALDKKYLYMAGEDKCNILDIKTGKVVKIVNAKDEWGYVATYKNYLIGSHQAKGTSYRKMADRGKGHPSSTAERDNRMVMSSDGLFAYDNRTFKKKWDYKGGRIMNPSIVIGDDTVFFAESSAEKLMANNIGRSTITDFCNEKFFIVALSLETGKVLWKNPLKLPYTQVMFCMYADGKVILSGSYNVNKKVSYEIIGIDAQKGKVVWNGVSETGRRTNGAHGEQWQHAIIVGNKVYSGMRVFDLKTGKFTGEEYLKGKGCGATTASMNHFYSRSRQMRMYPIKSEDGKTAPEGTYLCSTSRPGCWVNIIPASGLVLIPESSSGCKCNFALQTSLAFRSVGN